MLTEKGIKDSLWCPTMWLDIEGNPKRWMEPRYNDDTWELISSALTTGTTNKKAVVEKTTFGMVAEPYSKDFWLPLDCDTLSLLVTVRTLKLEREPGREWTLTIVRDRDYKPRDSDGIDAEKCVRRLLVKNAGRYFNVKNIVVETYYKGNMEPFICRSPLTEPQLTEAHLFFEKFREMANGETPLAARLDRCDSCWFKACPSRQETPPVNSGKPRTGML